MSAARFYVSSAMFACTALVVALAACAGREKVTPPPVAAPPAHGSEPQDAGSDQESDASDTSGDKTLRAAQADGDPTYLGVLDRKGLLVVIEQGLGRVLARLKVSAAMRNGRYEGFRVTEIDPGWAGAGINVGDVLLRLNGQSIERPEQAQAAFESLRVASEVALELARDGQKMTLRYRVE